MKIISESRIEECERHYHNFMWASDPASGFAFNCDANGVVIPRNAAALDNYRKCIDGTYAVIDRGVHTISWSYRVAAVGLCECGREVELDGFTCSCECGAEYNSSGQLLAPREQWGEETGEAP